MNQANSHTSGAKGEKPKRVVVIDDEEAVLSFVGRALTRRGFEVSLAPDGKMGLQLCRMNPPQLLITDIGMVGKDGLDVMMEIKKLPPPLPKIIAMSGAKSKYLKSAQDLGAVAILQKPFLLEELLAAVDSALPKP